MKTYEKTKRTTKQQNIIFSISPLITFSLTFSNWILRDEYKLWWHSTTIGGKTNLYRCKISIFASILSTKLILRSSVMCYEPCNNPSSTVAGRRTLNSLFPEFSIKTRQEFVMFLVLSVRRAAKTVKRQIGGKRCARKTICTSSQCAQVSF